MYDSLAEISIRRFLAVLVATCALVAAVGFGGVLVLGIVQGQANAFGRDIILFTVALSTASIVLPIASLVVGGARVSWRALGWRATRGRTVLLALVLTAAYLLLGALVYQAAGLGDDLDAFLERDLNTYLNLAAPDLFRLTAFLLIIGPLAAVAEEVLFRGFVFGWLRHRIRPVPAAILSAAVFSLAHLYYIAPGGVLGMAAAADIFLIGLVLAWLYQISGSLVPAIVMHAANNIAIVLTVLWSS